MSRIKFYRDGEPVNDYDCKNYIIDRDGNVFKTTKERDNKITLDFARGVSCKILPKKKQKTKRKIKQDYCNAEWIEFRLWTYIDYVRNIIVPNIFIDEHECDVLAISQVGYATEYEIKISYSDVLADQKKKHNHESNKLKNLYFVIPDILDWEKVLEMIPQRAGLLTVNERGGFSNKRNARINSQARPLTTEEISYVMRKGCLKIWGYKKKLLMKKGELE